MALRSENEEAADTAVSRIAALVSHAFGAVSTAMILLVLAITAVNVIARYLAGAPIRGAEEATGFLVVAIVMFGAAEAYRCGDHIKIDVLSNRFSLRTQLWLEGISHICVAVISGVLVWTGWHTVAFSRAFGAYSSGYLEIPLWIPQLALVAGGILLGFLAAVRFLELVQGRQA
jgi:TRAP-type C4-dicarboxylate transport system permease small subunit